LDYFRVARHLESAIRFALRFPVSDISWPYSFVCANGICEYNCKSTIRHSRRSN
jgi:hypothetical protein